MCISRTSRETSFSHRTETISVMLSSRRRIARLIRFFRHNPLGLFVGIPLLIFTIVTKRPSLSWLPLFLALFLSAVQCGCRTILKESKSPYPSMDVLTRMRPPPKKCDPPPPDTSPAPEQSDLDDEYFDDEVDTLPEGLGEALDREWAESSSSSDDTGA